MNEAAKSIFEKNTFWGVGSANFSLAADSQLYEYGNATFTNNSGSIINQMIAEKGVIGIIIYSLVICAILGQMFVSSVKIYYLLVLLPLGAIFIRELTFPAFLENSGIQLLALILLALSQNLYIKENSKWTYKLHLQKIHIYIPITLYGLLIIFSLERSKNEKYNEQLIIDISNKDFKNTKTYIGKLSDEVPYLINKSVVYREQYKAYSEKEALQKSEDCLRLAIEKNPYNILLLNNLSVVCYENGKQKEAFTIQKELTEKFESNALYNLNLYSFYYQTGNTKEAMHYLQAAIEDNPHILNTDFWTNIENDSTISTRHFLENIDLSFSTLDDPIKLAKYGVFLFYIKNYSKAKLSLKKSLEILPNLSYPWLLLSVIYYNEKQTDESIKCINRSLVLNSGDPFAHKILSLIESNQEEYIEFEKYSYPKEFNFLKGQYLVKYSRWYNTSSIPDIVYISDSSERTDDL